MALIWQDFSVVSAIDRQLEIVFALAIPLIVAFAVFAGNLVAARGLEPLRELANVASAIEALDLSQRLDVPPTRDELGLLCATFNRMLDRLEEAFGRERRFSSDASHELRAPLAVILAEADLTLRRRREPRRVRARAANDIAVQVGRPGSDFTRDLLAEARAVSVARARPTRARSTSARPSARSPATWPRSPRSARCRSGSTRTRRSRCTAPPTRCAARSLCVAHNAR